MTRSVTKPYSKPKRSSCLVITVYKPMCTGVKRATLNRVWSPVSCAITHVLSHHDCTSLTRGSAEGHRVETRGLVGGNLFESIQNASRTNSHPCLM